MARKVRVQHISKGYRALHVHPNALADLEARAARIAAATGDRKIIDATSSPIVKRNRAAVIAPDGDSDNKIIRALDAGR